MGGMLHIRITLLQRYVKALFLALGLLLFPFAFVEESATFMEQLMDINKDCTPFNHYLGQLNESFWLKAKPYRTKSEMYTYGPDEITPFSDLPFCSFQPDNQGSQEQEQEKDVPSWQQIEADNSNVMEGGEWKPSHCEAQFRIAIVIPYRDREPHLKRLLHTLHPFLRRQNLDYRIFVVEQAGDSPFNRGAVKNIGALVAMKLKQFDCIYFHDVDLIPLVKNNIYYCSDNPRHLSFTIKKAHSIEHAYSTHFGGVISLTKQQFINANGFSNIYFTWGSEDDDLSKRLRVLGYHIEQNDRDIGVYAMMNHIKGTDVRKRYWQLMWGHCRFLYDGLTTLPFEILEINKYQTHTHIKASIDEKLVMSSIPDIPETDQIGAYLKPMTKVDALKRTFWAI